MTSVVSYLTVPNKGIQSLRGFFLRLGISVRQVVVAAALVSYPVPFRGGKEKGLFAHAPDLYVNLRPNMGGD